MPIKIGNTSIADIKVGNTQINKVYQGTNLVYGKQLGFNINLYDTNDTLLYSVKSVNNKLPALPIPTKSGYIFQGWWTTKNYYAGYKNNGSYYTDSIVKNVIQHSGDIKCMGDSITSDIDLYVHWAVDPVTNGDKSRWIRYNATPEEKDCQCWNLNLNITGTLPEGTVITWTPGYYNSEATENSLWVSSTQQKIIFAKADNKEKLFCTIPGGDWYSISDLQNGNWHTLPWTLTCNTGVLTNVSYINIDSGYGHTGKFGIQINATFVYEDDL